LKIQDKIERIILKYPKQLIMFSIVLIGLLAPGLKNFQSEFDVRIWFRTTDPLIKALDQFERQFGNDETLITVVHNPDGIFNKKTLTFLRKFTDEMWKIPEVIRVDSIINYMDIQADGDEIIVEPFIDPDAELSESYIAKKKERAMSHRVLSGYLVSKDGNSILIAARLKPRVGGYLPDYDNIHNANLELINSYGDLGKMRIMASGSAAINHTFKWTSIKDMTTMVPLLTLMIIGILFWTFKSVPSVVFTMMIIVMSVLGTMGIMGWADVKFNNIVATAPGILLAICVADAVHILVTFWQGRKQGKDRIDSAKFTIDKNLGPTFLTSITTSIGFLSLATTELNPIKHLGMLSAFGTMLAWFLTFTVLVPMLLLIPLKVPKTALDETEESKKKAREKSYSYVKVLRKFSMPIIIFFMVTSVLATYLALQNEVNSNPYNYFDKDHPLSVANNFIIDTFGGTTGAELVIDSGVPNGIKGPEFLRKVDKLNEWLLEQGHISKTISVLDVVKQMNQSLHQDKLEFYSIPDDQEAVAQLLFLYTMGLPQGMDLNDRMTLDYRRMRMSIMWSTQDSRTYVTHMDQVNEKVEELGLVGEINGKFPLYQRMNGYIVDTFVWSIGLAILMVTLVMTIFFKSIKLGILSMFPNIMPLPFGLAAMTLLGIPVDMGASLVTSVCLGIAVDDTIHFIATFRKGRKKGMNVDDALAALFESTGPSLVITTIILVFGFGMFLTGDFLPNFTFGVLTALGLSMALIIDIMFLPALLIALLKLPFFKKAQDK
jgi:uncharacterized protein